MNDETLAVTKYSLNWHSLVKPEVMSLVTLLKYDMSACLHFTTQVSFNFKRKHTPDLSYL